VMVSNLEGISCLHLFCLVAMCAFNL